MTSNYGTTSATASNITGLTLALSTNHTYRVTAVLKMTCATANGLRFAIGAPTGASLQSGVWAGSSTSNNASQQSLVGGLNVLNTGNAFMRNSSNTGMVTLIAYISTSTTSGNVTLQVASATEGDTSTILSGSTMDIIQLN
jgi:hypothetical protein